jgi:hypothetical protein
MNVLLDETRSKRLDVALPIMDQLRVTATTYAILLEEKPSDQSWGDFAIRSMITAALMGRIMRGELRGAYRLLVRFGAIAADEPATVVAAAAPDLTSVRRPDERQQPARSKASR